MCYNYAFHYIDPACLEIETTNHCYMSDRSCLHDEKNGLNDVESKDDKNILPKVLTVFIGLLLLIVGIIGVVLCIKRIKSKLSIH